MSLTVSKASTRPASALRSTRLHQALAAALLIGLTPMAVNAATIVVTSPDDTALAAANTCTLRQAIVSMNAPLSLQGSCTNSVPGDAFGTNDTITFAASSFNTPSGATTPGTVTLADSADSTGSIGGTLVITAANLTIDASAWRGGGAGQYPGGITITRSATATNAFGIVRDTAATGSSLTLNGLTLSQGNAAATCNGYPAGGGVCIPAANLTLVDSTVSGNSARGGGGIYSTNGTLALTDSTVSNNSAQYGGGIYSSSGTLILTHSTISGNSATAGRGGGIYPYVGTLTLTDSTVSGNTATADGGGIYSYTGTLTVTNSTLSGNSTTSNGGGIYSRSGTLTVTNSTLSDNSASRGGGITSAGTLALTNTTVSNNTAQTLGGGVYGGGGVTIDQSIVSGNIQASGNDISLTTTPSGGNNLIAVTPASLNLGPLQNNGGPTQTMLPGAGSIAINAISCASAPPLDQRGMLRPDPASAGVTTPCDIGAVEANSISDEIFANGFEMQ